MREKKSAAAFIAIAVLGLAGGIGAHVRSANQEPADAPISDEERVHLLAKGKRSSSRSVPSAITRAAINRSAAGRR